MQSIKITGNEVKIYRKDKTSKNGKAYTTYFIKFSSKDSEGEWKSAFLDVQFKKGVSVDNKAVINIQNAFYIVNAYNGNTSLKLMITDFEVVSGGEPTSLPTFTDDGFMSIPDGMEDDLPFI